MFSLARIERAREPCSPSATNIDTASVHYVTRQLILTADRETRLLICL